MSRSDTIDGWRDRRAGGGVVIEVESGAVAELYDTSVIPGALCPMALGFAGGEILRLVTHEDLPAT